jgi:competence protein ComEC
VVRGLALGGGDGLSQATAQAFRDAGLWHLLAVSGQNIAIVAFAVLAALRGAGVGRRASVGAAGVVLVAYCLACDGGASVARAGIVGALGLTAELGSRARDRWHLLLAGLVALVLHQPRAVGDPGLQLSFAAVVGILAVAPPVAAVLRGWMSGRVADLAGQAAGATLATAPVVIWHFGTLSLAGLVVNVVAVPLAAPVVILALCGIGLAVVLPPAAVAAGWLAGVGAGALIGVARIAAAAPAATVPLPRWSVPLAALPAVAIPLVAGRTWAVTPPRLRPPRWAAPAAGAIAAVVAVALAVPRPGAGGRWPAAAAVTALDIGQGDAILLRSPDGAAALIDTGPPGAPAPVVARLRDAGVRRLDALLLTHHQLDHDGAAAAVLRAVAVGVVLTASASPAAEAEARARGIASRRVSAGDAVRVGSWSLEVLWPRQEPPRADDPNDASMVILARSAGMAALLTADAESGVLRRLPVGRVDVLKVSHHGSADPGLGPLLDRLRPAAALISVGAGNRYGHPDRATLDALDAAGVRVARTDRVGSATVTVAGGGAALSAERSATGVSAP